MGGRGDYGLSSVRAGVLVGDGADTKEPAVRELEARFEH
jgi:hypothetical protein